MYASVGSGISSHKHRGISRKLKIVRTSFARVPSGLSARNYIVTPPLSVPPPSPPITAGTIGNVRRLLTRCPRDVLVPSGIARDVFSSLLKDTPRPKRGSRCAFIYIGITFRMREKCTAPGNITLDRATMEPIKARIISPADRSDSTLIKINAPARLLTAATSCTTRSTRCIALLERAT